MEKTAESVVSVDVAGVGLAVIWERLQGSGLCQCAVRAMMVEVVLVRGQDRRRVGWLMMRMRSRSSRRMLPMNCSAMAFARGARTGVL